MENLLKIVVADSSLYSQYLFDEQFAHQDWSAMVASVKREPETLLHTCKITLHDLIIFELLLLEIDDLYSQFGDK